MGSEFIMLLLNGILPAILSFVLAWWSRATHCSISIPPNWGLSGGAFCINQKISFSEHTFGNWCWPSLNNIPQQAYMRTEDQTQIKDDFWNFKLIPIQFRQPTGSQRATRIRTPTQPYLNPLSATVKCHPSSCKENTCKLSNIFSIHVLLWPVVKLQAFLLGDNGNDLHIHWWLFLLWPEQKGNYILTSCTLTIISLLSPDTVFCFRTRCHHF